MMHLRSFSTLGGLAAAVALAGCGDDAESPPTDDQIEVPSTYTFASRFTDASSVAYTGQVKRHLLIARMTAYIANLTDQSFPAPQPGDVVEALRYFHEFATAGGAPDEAIGFDPGVAEPMQMVWGDLGSLTTLSEKMPENDNTFPGGVVGYADGSLPPEEALFDMFEQLEGLIIARAQGNVPVDPTGAEIAVPFVSASGVDYQQLIQKYMVGAIALSQAADDYLDDDRPGKGLLSDNTEVSGDSPYTALEHQWDEGFGYFGAARDYGDYTDDEVAKKGGRPEYQGAHDTNGDGMIDLTSEYNFGHSQNAAKRDRGSVRPTDFSQDAFDAFLAGRTLIVNAQGALTDAELDELRGYRDEALLAWERAIAATAVHYVNDTLQDMAKFDTPDYDFLDHAKHWSELKGFALALQFDLDHSPLTSAQHQELHQLIGNAPALPGDNPDDIAAYQASLRQVRTLLAGPFGFDAENLGDDNGENGW